MKNKYSLYFCFNQSPLISYHNKTNVFKHRLTVLDVAQNFYLIELPVFWYQANHIPTKFYLRSAGNPSIARNYRCKRYEKTPTMHRYYLENTALNHWL